jgi:hypothetical protein
MRLFMRFGLAALAATVALTTSAGAQWTTVCIHHTSRLMTCRTTHDPPAPVRAAGNARSNATALPRATELQLAPDDAVLGVWRASGVRFESRGRRTSLEVRVTAIPRGIHLEVPTILGLPGGHWFDLRQVGPRVYRATDRVGRVTTFHVDGDRAELVVTGAGGAGVVTYQFDEHERSR